MFENSIIMFVFSPITHSKVSQKRRKACISAPISIVETWSLTYFFGIICLIRKVFYFTKLNDLRKPMRCLYEKILVVDDERPISDIIKFNLTKEGYEVVTALMVVKL